ncbi:MAG: deoxyribodipyrimidine photo-lyase [Candidatus Eremiobacteraeota bacterium]|nr:deoxyribodipyrimidine photo-lyase [Candidatus Eremiobacteraeota bacterium]
MSTSLLWFRRDLRLTDNVALHAARASSERVFAVYCTAELERLNARQHSFVSGSLQMLRATLDKHDATLTIADGTQPHALIETARRLGASAVHCSRTYARADRVGEEQARAALQRDGIELHVHRGDMIHEPQATAELKQAPGDGYRVFPPYLAAWRSLDPALPVAQTLPNGRDERPGPIPEPGTATVPAPGETAASAALDKFTTARAADYAVNAPYPARDGTSNLAPYLRFGCISPRVVYQTLARRMSWSWTLASERASMSLFVRQLALRDFFTQLAYFVPALHDDALQEKMRSFPWSEDRAHLEAWREGRTGYPLVDAAMRQLRAQGLVHQRAAICAASFCCFDLGLDWRLGRRVWMEEHVAADDALCDGNWQWLAGVGPDQAAYPRIYNPEKQARQFDAQAVYVRHWVPELKKLPTSAALAPWRVDHQHQIELGFFTPKQYPRPIVDREKTAREFLARYRAFASEPARTKH